MTKRNRRLSGHVDFEKPSVGGTALPTRDVLGRWKHEVVRDVPEVVLYTIGGRTDATDIYWNPEYFREGEIDMQAAELERIIKTTITAELSPVARDIGVLTERVGTIVTRLDTVNDRLEAVADKFSAVATQIAVQQSNITTLQTDVAGHSTEIDDQGTKLTELSITLKYIGILISVLLLPVAGAAIKNIFF